jgi:hypothetical protein
MICAYQDSSYREKTRAMNMESYMNSQTYPIYNP